MENGKTRIRVATFNIGDFSTGAETAGNRIRYGNGTKLSLERLEAVMKRVNADLWGLQEDSGYFFWPDEIKPAHALYHKILPYHTGFFTRTYNGKAFLSRFIPHDVALLQYPAAVTSYAPEGTMDYGHDWFLTGKISVGGKEITVVTLHFDWNCKERRAIQHQTLLNFIKKQEYCIVTGDFNPENYVNSESQCDAAHISTYREEWQRFTDAGLVHANGGAFGTFGTLMEGGKPQRPEPWDNVLVTPNIRILHAEPVYEPWMEDHAIVVADLEI